MRGNQLLLRQLNEALILDAVRQRGAISRADIARVTGLTTATVSNLTAALMERGLLVEVGAGDSKGGRKPTLLRLHAPARHALAVGFGFDAITVLVLDLESKPLVRCSEPLGDDASPVHVVAQIDRLAQEAIRRAGIDPATLVGTGVSVPGIVDPASGNVEYVPYIRWQNVPLAAMLAERLRVRVVLENDANAAAFGEFWCGAIRGTGDGVFVYVDLGIGAGFLVRGEVYRGRNNAAGEFGHTSLDLQGPLCHCGNRGCLGLLASGRAIVRRVREAVAVGGRLEPVSLAGAGEPGLDQVLAAARAGDPTCLEAIRTAAMYLGAGLANLINLYNPAALVLGGKVALEAPGYWEAAAAAAAERMYPVFRNQVNLVLSALGPDAPAIGAGCLVLRPLFRAAAQA